ncbi:MAG: DNA translocase FtsK 4TM domain-containing protein [Paracoccaceae bacterium]
MASYQARQRDPLLDSDTQAILERRGKELLGVGLLVAGVVAAMILGSYSPEDPSWMSATDEPARNLLGRFGASIASPLYIISGVGSWGICAVLIAWGARFLFHRGEERSFGRVIFAPIAVALASVYASTHVPGSDWTHSFGLGGLFGDTVLGAILGVVPIKATLGLKVMALLMALGTLAMSLFVLGFTMVELRRIGRFLGIGVIMAYATLLRLTGKGAIFTLRAAQHLRERQAERRFERQSNYAETATLAYPEPQISTSAQPVVRRTTAPLTATRPGMRAEPTVTAPSFAGFTKPQAEPKPGLLARVPSLLKRAPVAVVPEQRPTLAMADDFGDPRIKAKIADVLKNRVGRIPATTTIRTEPPVAGRDPHGAQPMVLSQPMVPGAGRTMPADLPQMEIEDELYADPLLDDEPDDYDYSQQYQVPPIPDPKKVVQHALRKPAQPSRQARAEAQPGLQFEEKASAYETPPLNLLMNADGIERHHLSDEALEENARMLESVLDDYGVKGEIVSVRPGPVVTMYELEPAPGLKASRVIGLADDIARSMSALSARVSTVPGRSVIGIELPNVYREKVVLREILAARDFGDSNMRLPLALGKDIGGDPIVANLAKMPHLLIAGTTGSGKSVAINTMILSLLYKLTPDECRLIMIDPKMLELSVYDGIPHLLSPVVTDPKKAVVALKWVVGEMEDRYRKMSKMGVRNIEGFNGRVRDALAKNEMFKRTVQTGFDDETGEPVFETDEFKPETIPYIVVIVDEMADLMMVAGKEIEACIQRLAQMARASGIHLIMATQRPSVDVITGTIKANFPTRISFQVTSKIDSRTILGEQGAEQLLGMGDMLFMAGGAKITRVHGPFVSDEEVEEIVNFLKSFGPPEYMNGVTEGQDEDTESSIDLVLGLGGNTDGDDALYDQAVQIVIKDRKCSTSYIQRKLAIGYNKAARLVEQMEDNGLVSAANHVGKREILVPEQ